MSTENIKGRIAAHKASAKKILDKISKKKWEVKYKQLTKPQKTHVDREFMKNFSDYPVTPEIWNDKAEIEKRIKKIPAKQKGTKVTKETFGTIKKDEAFYILNEGNKPKKCQRVPFQSEKEIEDLLEQNPEILEKNSFIIGRQVRTNTGKIIDLLGLDEEANVMLVEIKKAKTPDYVSSQILDYFVWAEDLSQPQLNQIAKKNYIKGSDTIENKFRNHFGHSPEHWNQNPKLFIVGEEIDEETKKIAKKLNKLMEISCMELNIYQNKSQKMIYCKKF